MMWSKKSPQRRGGAWGIDGWRVVDDDYGQTVGKLQVESMMSTAASLFPQQETKVCRSGEEQTVRLKVMLDSLVTLQQGR
jgi:hypothetical protein